MTPADLTWTAQSVCKDWPDLFFAPERQLGYNGPAWSPEPALALCRVCPVLTECRAYAIGHGDIDADGVAVHGVIGGAAPRVKDNGYRPAVPTMKRCQVESCRRLFMGHARQSYCSPECYRIGRTAQQREYHRRTSGAA